MNNETIWAVMTVKQQSSRHHCDTIFKLELASLDGDIAITYVDPHNDNYKNWQHVCDRPHKGFFLDNLVEADYEINGELLIDADSDVEIWHEDTKQIVLDAYEEFTRPPREKIFADLFGI